MILATALLTASVSSSNPLPDAPRAMITAAAPKAKHPTLNRYDYALYGGIVAYRVGDFLTTEHLLHDGGHEVELPKVMVENKSVFAIYSGAMAAGEIYGSYWLHRHGHAKLARFADSLSLAAGTSTDLRNVNQIYKQERINARK